MITDTALDARLAELVLILNSHAGEAEALASHLHARGGQAMAANLLNEIADCARTLRRLQGCTVVGKAA